MFQRNQKLLETSLASKERIDERLHMHSNKHLPLHSKCTPLIGLMATCDDEPVPNLLSAAQATEKNIDERERQLKQHVDQIVFGTGALQAPLYKRIKTDNIFMLQAERDEEEPEMVREARELTRISKAVLEQNHTDAVERRKRQQIIENDVGIRGLTFQLNKARATVSLERQIREFHEKKDEDAADARKERNETLERIEREKREETAKKKAKNAAYREALLEQIESRRAVRVSNETALREEDRMRREAYIKRLNETEALERSLNAERKAFLKQDIDNYMEMQQHYRSATTRGALPGSEIGLLDSCRAPTALARHLVEEKRKRLQAERARCNVGIAEHLQKHKEEQLKRDDIIFDLVVRERSSREEKEHQKLIQARYEKRKQINDALLEQRMQDSAQRMLQRYNEKYVTLPSDIRSFRQRQHLEEQRRCERSKRESYELGKFLQATIQEKVEQRKVAAAEDMTNALKRNETHEAQDRLAKAERHIMLANEPIESLASLRNGVLSEEEMKRYGVPKRTAVALERKPERSAMCSAKINYI